MSDSYTLFPSSAPKQATTPAASSRRAPPSPTLTAALRSLGSGGNIRSQILSGPVVDGFPASSADQDIHPPHRAGTGGLFKQHTRIAAADNDTAGGLDSAGRPNHTKNSPRKLQRRGLPPLTTGVLSRGPFSKTRGHYEHGDSSHWLAVANAKGSSPQEANMSDTSKEIRAQQVEGQDHVASTGAGARPLTRKQKAARHCKRRWWVHLLLLIAIVVLVVCLM